MASCALPGFALLAHSETKFVALWHGEETAREAEEHFTRVVRKQQAPEDVPESDLPEGDPLHLPALLPSTSRHVRFRAAAFAVHRRPRRYGP